MNNIQKRAIAFGVIFVIAILFLFPTIKVAVKKYKGQEVTSADTVDSKWISKPISLGLDLSGGVHLVYQVETEEAIKGRLQVTANSLRNSLRKEKIAVTKVGVNKDDTVFINLLTDRNQQQAKDLILKEREGLQLVSENKKGSGVELVYAINDTEKATIRQSSVEQSIETLRSRVDKFGVSEPVIQKVGESRILLQMPGVQDIESVKRIVGKVAKLEFRLLPVTPNASGTVTLKDKDGTPIQVEDIVQMGGEAVSDAMVSFDQNGQVEVSLTLNPDGAKTFSNLTGANVNRNLAIILDGVVHSSPVIRQKISGGRCSISGGFTMEEARELAVVLRAGALPAPLTILEERTVGPTLGAESIRSGMVAIVIGFVAILVFMTLYYKKAGLVASLILAINVVFVLAGLSAFGATLTLPGLAGLALTVGMAVDANVISFERIREELRNGVTRDKAVEAGFSKALSAILDSNLTTLLIGFILYYFGTGPIKGFAVTLSIGVITTVFCATFVARLAFDTMKLKGNNQGLSI